jgi:hypothetical protein
MIFKGHSDLSPKVTISIDAVPVDYMSIKRLTVELRENMHNVVILEIAGLNPQLITEYVDRPTKITIEMRERDTFTFCGYLAYLEPFSMSHEGTVNKSPFQMTRLYCFGASYVMKSKYSRIWENVTLSEIATELADKHKFSVSVPNDTYRFSRLVQSAESDWEFLIRSSRALGYSVVAENSHLHIWDRYKAISRKRSYSTLYTIRGTGGDPSPQPGQILTFDGRIGSVTPNGSRTFDTIHVLDRAGNLISISNEESSEQSSLGIPLESPFTNTLNVNADSYSMGQKLVTGALRQKFPLFAKVDVVGDPAIQPGGIVNINEYDTQFDGFWYVTNVHHEITMSTMLTSLEIIKDSLGTATTDPSVTTMYTTPPETALQNGVWVSERELVNVYV